MAVHLDIRPRLTLPAEPRVRARPRWRLPPLAVPAVGYWLAMAGLTYGFTRLGPNPLEGAVQPAAEPTPATAPAVEPQDALEPAPALPPPPPTDPAPLVVEAAPPVERESAPAPVARDEHETESENRDNREAGRRGGFLGSRRDETEARTERREESRVAMAFPEFTDSSRPKARERAADGPRIDSLFERTEERPAKDSSDTVAPPESAPAPVAVSSCEAAIARNNEQLTIGARRGPADITREAYAGILQNGRYLAGCTIPDRTVFEVCAAVKDGRAVGITIASNPPNAALNACVRSAVSRLQFPQNPRMDVTHTRFDAVKR